VLLFKAMRFANSKQEVTAPPPPPPLSIPHETVMCVYKVHLIKNFLILRGCGHPLDPMVESVSLRLDI